MIYLFVFILLLIPVLKYDLMAKTGGERGWFCFNLVVLILLAGLRYRVGGDTLMYMSIYDDLPSLADLKYFDFAEADFNPLWYIYAAVCKSIGEDFVVMQIIQAIFVNSVFFFFFKKYSPRYYFSAILLFYIGYYCYFNMEIMREILCVCILMLMTSWIFEKRWLPYYAGCVVALFIHYSSVIMLFIPFLVYFFKKPSWKLLLFFALGLAVLASSVNILLLLAKLVVDNEGLLIVIERYSDKLTNINGMMLMFLKLLPFIGFMYIRNRFNLDYQDKFAPFATGLVFMFSLAMGLFIFERLANYFVPYVIVFSVNTIYRFLSELDLKKVQVSGIVFAMSLLVMSFNFFRYYMRDMSEYYPNTRFNVIFTPYHSILDPEIEEHRERFIENYRDVNITF